MLENKNQLSIGINFVFIFPNQLVVVLTFICSSTVHNNNENRCTFENIFKTECSLIQLEKE